MTQDQASPSARRLTFAPSRPCPNYGSPPWIAAFLRLTDAGFDVEVALELAAADYDVLGFVRVPRFIAGGAA